MTKITEEWRRALERATDAEAHAKQHLNAAEDRITTGAGTRGDLADAYEDWLIAVGAKQRANEALARVIASRESDGWQATREVRSRPEPRLQGQL